MDAHAPALEGRATRRVHRPASLTLLWLVLMLESALWLLAAIVLSQLAGDHAAEGTDAARSAEIGLRFAAAGAFLVAIAAFVAILGVRRLRPWGWTWSALLQVLLAIATGIAMFTTEAEGGVAIYLVAFGLAALGMLVLSMTSVRRWLGQA